MASTAHSARAARLDRRAASRISPASTIDLSTYVRVGRFPLPVPPGTTPPPGSLLAQEASAVTYNWDTDTLFVVGDGGTSIVQVTKTGQLIDSMTLAPGGSPQGTDFYDPEGLTYVGGGQFVMSEERDRQVVLFTYAPGTTLTRAATQTVKLGTFARNIGTRGPLLRSGRPAASSSSRKCNPQGIFQTGIDFVAGTATNGSPTTMNSIEPVQPGAGERARLRRRLRTVEPADQQRPRLAEPAGAQPGVRQDRQRRSLRQHLQLADDSSRPGRPALGRRTCSTKA